MNREAINAIAVGNASASGKKAAILAVVLLCIAPFAYLCSAGLVPRKQIIPTIAEIERSTPSQPLLEGAAFSGNAVYPTTIPPVVNGKLTLNGSWLKSNLPIGQARTAWLPYRSNFCFFESGYPTRGGNNFHIEVRTSDSTIVKIPVAADSEPGEYWLLHCISLPKSKYAKQFRFVATDASPDWWFGFSQPFVVQGTDAGEALKQIWLLIATSGAAFFFFLVPGLILRQKFPKISMIWVWVPGVMILCSIGLLAWKGPAWLSPAAIARGSLWLIAIYGSYRLIRVPLTTYTSAMERKTLLVTSILICVAVAKATYSVDPAGELYGGTISKTLEVGARSDSRVPYIAVQLAGLRLSGYSDFATHMFAPWNFSHRGPVAGLAAAAIALAGPITVQPLLPNEPWTIFDPEGFAAYRTTMIVIAACSLLSVFGLALFFLDEQWAFLAFLFCATAPFVVHEIYFTWPKILSAAFVLLTFYLLCRERYVAAGFWLGIGYLTHPSALFWTPFIIIAAFLANYDEKAAFTNRRQLKRLFSMSMRFAAGLIPIVLCWLFINRKHFGQPYYLTYFAMANRLPPTVHNWVHSRIDSVLNTLVPLYLFVVNRDDPAMNSIFGRSPSVVEFSLQYWNALPFGAGLAFYCAPFAVLIAAAYKHARNWFLFVFSASLLLFALYMGYTTTGMLRDGLHPWLLGLMIFLTVVFRCYFNASRRFWAVLRWALFARANDLIVMLLLAPVISRHRLFSPVFEISDVLALSVMVAGSIWAAWYAFRFCRQLGQAVA